MYFVQCLNTDIDRLQSGAATFPLLFFLSINNKGKRYTSKGREEYGYKAIKKVTPGLNRM